MKYLTLVIALLLVSCAPQFVSYKTNSRLLPGFKNIRTFQEPNSGKPDQIGSIKVNDTTSFKADLIYKAGAPFFLSYFRISYNNENYYVSSNEVKNILTEIIANQDSTLTITKEEENIAWARALNFVLATSTMKVQLQNDLIIETFNPVYDWKGIGWSINKLYKNNDVVISIRCVADEKYIGLFKRICVYYIKTGDEAAINYFKDTFNL